MFKNTNKESEIYCDDDEFGFGDFLAIWNDCNLNRDSYCDNFGYQKPANNKVLAGAEIFGIADFELFQIL